ncbi:MAG: ThuA domain-containing protein [Flavobacteriaceae bacterium]
MHKSKLFLFVFLLFVFVLAEAQSLSSFELNSEWIAKIESKVKNQKKVATHGKKKLLIFSLHTGYKHWTIPHTEAVMSIIAQNSGVFEVTLSRDYSVFDKNKISKYDVIVLNNTNSKSDRRDLFWDIFNEDSKLSRRQKTKKAKQMEDNLIQFVKKGKGLMLLHGAIVMQNNSIDFSDMVGGSFDFHPPQQEIHVKLVDPNHPLVSSFDSEGFIHYDEPYFFKNAYFRYEFRPLLYMELDEIKMKRERPTDKIKYISWIKRYGRGRVFYSSPSHNAHSYENPKLLQFLRNGLLYTAGFIDCDDSPIEKSIEP